MSALVSTGQLRFVRLSAPAAATAHSDSATAARVKDRCDRVARAEYVAKGNNSVLYDCRPTGPPSE
jgi:hypothetical protein